MNKPYMIILKRTDSESLIAHKIAHAYLNYTKAKSKSAEDQEAQADELRKNGRFNPHCPESNFKKRG